MLEPETLIEGIAADPDPVHIALPYVHYPAGVIYETVDLAFQYRLKILLHLTAEDLNYNCQRQGFLILLQPVDIRAD